MAGARLESVVRFRRKQSRRKSVAPVGGFRTTPLGSPPVDTGGTGVTPPIRGLIRALSRASTQEGLCSLAKPHDSEVELCSDEFRSAERARAALDRAPFLSNRHFGRLKGRSQPPNGGDPPLATGVNRWSDPSSGPEAPRGATLFNRSDYDGCRRKLRDISYSARSVFDDLSFRRRSSRVCTNPVEAFSREEGASLEFGNGTADGGALGSCGCIQRSWSPVTG